jgi:predicted DsbA family dithiol-disulfide isomerase
MTIDVYSDVVCPWCFIGTRRLSAVLASLDGEIDATVRHHPYVLQPGTPSEGTDLHRMLRERYGTDPAEMFVTVEAAAREAGIPLDLSKQRMTYSTLGAHTLLRHAEEKGTQHALLDALFTAYFLDARNVSDPAVLADVATKHGFTAGEVERLLADETELARTRSEVREAAMRGVRGVPLFIFNQRLVLSGAQPADVFRDAIAKARA